MGRYYTGDIDGKFWFGIQESDDASFFGGSETEPNYLDYYFSKQDLPDIENGIKQCKKSLGQYEEALNKFLKKLKKFDSYSSEDIETEAGIPKDQIDGLLRWYARLELGTKILECVEKHGDCTFQAEL